MRSVEIETKPIPRPAMAKTMENSVKDVEMENESVIPQPAKSKTEPSRAEGFSFRRWIICPQINAPTDHPRLKGTMAIPS